MSWVLPVTANCFFDLNYQEGGPTGFERLLFRL
jgi:hypothetical protein